MKLIVDGIRISTPISQILKTLKGELNNGKLHTIKESGDDILVPCPRHKNGLENRASCGIYCGQDESKYGMVHCFTCDFKGPFWRFVAECFNSSDDYAKEWLIERFGEGRQTNKVVDSMIPIELEKTSNEAHKEFDFSHMSSYHPYMTKRKLSREICERFGVKYDPNTSSLVFPVYDGKGKIVTCTRRSVQDKSFYIEKGLNKPLYLLNYINKYNLNFTIITEGQIDALTSWEYGLPCVATMGNPSEYQIDELNKSQVRFVVLMFDNDESGRKFTERVKSSIREDIFVFVSDIGLVHKKDINDLTKDEFIYIINSCGVNYNNLVENVKNHLTNAT